MFKTMSYFFIKLFFLILINHFYLLAQNTNISNKNIIIYDKVPDKQCYEELSQFTDKSSVETFKYFPFLLAKFDSKDIKPISELNHILSIQQLQTDEIINIMKAFEFILDSKEKYNISTINLSLGPRKSFNYYEYDPIIIAIKKCIEKSIVVVVSAGNSGLLGDNTLNPWSLGDLVISVGAVDSAKILLPNSSRGIPGDPFYHPTVVASSHSTLELFSMGTSFASARVSSIVAQLVNFYRAVFKKFGININKISEIEKEFPKYIKRTIKFMAQSIPREQHLVGAGYIDEKVLYEYVSNFSLAEFMKIFDKMFDNEEYIRISQKLEKDSSPIKINEFNSTLAFIDVKFDWNNSPVFVQNLFKPLEHMFWGLCKEKNVYRGIPYVFITHPYINDVDIINIAVDKKKNKRFLIVNRILEEQKLNHFSKITDAINEAQSGDTIFIKNGIYEENIELKKDLIIIGEKKEDVIIKSKANTTIFANSHLKNVLIRNVTIISEAENKEAIFISASNTIIQNCIIISASNGIVVRPIEFAINKCTINAKKIGILASRNGDKPEQINDNRYNVYISECVIQKCEYASYIYSMGCFFVNNTIVNNLYGLALLDSVYGYVYNNIFAYNDYHVRYKPKSKIVFKNNNCFHNDDFSHTNIKYIYPYCYSNKKPRFVDYQNGNFTLSIDSPLNKSSCNKSYLGAIPSDKNFYKTNAEYKFIVGNDIRLEFCIK